MPPSGFVTTTPESAVDEPASVVTVVPPSCFTMMPPQTPDVWPGTIVQGRPTQQSALLVHVLPAGRQAAPHLLATQGLPQQSALVAQTVSAGTGWVQFGGVERVTQRGMPSASRRQHFSGLLLQLPPWMSGGSQQLFSALQE